MQNFFTTLRYDLARYFRVYLQSDIFYILKFVRLSVICECQKTLGLMCIIFLKLFWTKGLIEKCTEQVCVISGRYADVQIASFLILKGRASVHMTTSTGASALHGAALQGNLGAPRLILFVLNVV
jgi:hypothetical protein